MKNYRVFGVPEGEIPIGGYISPPPASREHPDKPSLVNEETYFKVKECGVDFLVCFYESLQEKPAEFAAALKAAEAAGVKLMIRDDNFYAYRAFDEEAFARSKAAYEDSPAFAGIHVCDEPGFLKFELLRDMREALERHCPGKTAYVNLFPYFATPRQLYSDLKADAEEQPDYDYARYLGDYLKIVRPPYLSFDYYPLTEEEGRIYPEYYGQLATIRQAAAKADVPFWAFVQTTHWWPPFRTPVFSEIQYQVSTALAFGAKGIQYFPFCTPNGFTGAETFHRAVLDLSGNRTSVFSAVQYANRHIKAVSPVLAESEHLGLVARGELPVELPASCARKDIPGVREFGAAHALAGVFARGAEIAVYVVNQSMKEEDAAILRFDGARRVTVIAHAQRTETVTDFLALKIGAGEGVLVRL